MAAKRKAGDVLPHAKGKISEKEKAFAAWRGQFILKVGNVWQLPPLEGGEWIIVKQRTRFLFAKPVDNHVVRSLQAKWAGSRIVRVAGHEMNESLSDPPQRILLGTGAETAAQRASGHLGEASLAYPFFQALRPRTQNRIALRVGDHRLHAGELNHMQRLVHRGRDRKLVEFNKQEIALIDAILPGVLSQGFEILRVEVKIAAGGNFQPLAGLCLQLIAKPTHAGKIEKIFAVGVRRSNNVSDHLRNRRFRYWSGFLHCVCAIIEARQSVAVQIHHWIKRPLAPPRIQGLPCAKQDQYPGKNLPHASRLDLLRQHSPGDAAQKHSRNQEQPGFPRHESVLRIRHQCQHSGGWNQRNQGGPLRTMLAERKQQPQQRHKKYAAANPEHSGRDSAHTRDREDARAAAHRFRHELLLAAAGHVRVSLRLSPKQKSRQYQEAAEQSFQIPGWHR